MDIEGGAISTNGGLSDLTYASIDVGSEYSGEDVIIQIFYSRDGSLLNNGNMVPMTVTSDGFINIRSADAYKYFPDHANITIFNTENKFLDSYEVNLSPTSGIQTFGLKNYDFSYISGNDISFSSTGGNTYNSDNSYVGNLATGKFHDSGCRDVNKMNSKNKVYFSNRQDALQNGYSPVVIATLNSYFSF